MVSHFNFKFITELIRTTIIPSRVSFGKETLLRPQCENFRAILNRADFKAPPVSKSTRRRANRMPSNLIFQVQVSAPPISLSPRLSLLPVSSHVRGFDMNFPPAFFRPLLYPRARRDKNVGGSARKGGGRTSKTKFLSEKVESSRSRNEETGIKQYRVPSLGKVECDSPRPFRAPTCEVRGGRK